MSTTRILLRYLLAIFFVVAGANHFRAPEIYLGMMPPWVPWPAGMNIISGVAEILGGMGIVIPRTRRAAGWGLILLLLAVFPANVYVARMGSMPGTEWSARALWLRLPLQAVLIAGVWWVAVRRKGSVAQEEAGPFRGGAR